MTGRRGFTHDQACAWRNDAEVVVMTLLRLLAGREG
jgi:hypothetical protein